MSDGRIPVLPRGVRLHHDRVRDRQVLLGPERVLMLDETGQAILSELDGRLSISRIAARLAKAYDAPEDAVAADVVDFVDGLARQRLVDFVDG